MRWLPALLLVCACTTRPISATTSTPETELRDLIPSSSVPELDILFVVDNSDSMKEEQDSLAQNFPRFMDVLSGIEGGLPSLHVGVVSSEVGIAPYSDEQCEPFGDDGLLQSAPRGACAGPAGAFIEDVVGPGGTRLRNYEGKLADTFGCIAALGITGCGYEQHLEAMRRALDGTRAENAGFLRPDAYLAVVIVADEDDCSARDPAMFNPDPALRALDGELGPAEFRCLENGVLCDGVPPARRDGDFQHCVPRGDSYLRHPQEYVDFLRGLKDDPGLLIVAVIAGDPAPVGAVRTEHGLRVKPSCTSASGDARPGVRLEHFARQFGGNGRDLSICEGDLRGGLTEVAELLARKIAAPCLAAGVDVEDLDDAAPGLQLECVVSDVHLGKSTVLPRCAMADALAPRPTSKPCWWVAPSASCEKGGNGLALHVERDGETPAGTRVVAQCRGQI